MHFILRYVRCCYTVCFLPSLVKLVFDVYDISPRSLELIINSNCGRSCSPSSSFICHSCCSFTFLGVPSCSILLVKCVPPSSSFMYDRCLQFVRFVRNVLQFVRNFLELRCCCCVLRILDSVVFFISCSIVCTYFTNACPVGVGTMLQQQ